MLKDLFERVSVLASTSKLERVLAEYEALIEQEPHNAKHWLRHGQICERLGQVSLAVVSYRTAALLLGDQTLYGQAVAAVKLAIRLAPEDEMLLNEWVRIERLKPKGLSEFYAKAVTERVSVIPEPGHSST